MNRKLKPLTEGAAQAKKDVLNQIIPCVVAVWTNKFI